MTDYLRRVIRIRAEDSPNVALARRQQALGIPATGNLPSGRPVLEGVLSWELYQLRRATWDTVRQTVGLDAEFWEGADALLYPPEWLNRAEGLARSLASSNAKRSAKAIGVDPGEGGDDTAYAVVDELGLVYLRAEKTPDTDVICGTVLALMGRWSVPAHAVVFDRGGGGKQHSDRLRKRGHAVRTVAFGESPSLDPRHGVNPLTERVEAKEDRYVYVNRRAEMYDELSQLLDPVANPRGFAIPAAEVELRRQMAPVRRSHDGEGRMFLPPKRRKDAKDTRTTLTEILGCSPDELDALVLAVHGMLHSKRPFVAGAVR